MAYCRPPGKKRFWGWDTKIIGMRLPTPAFQFCEKGRRLSHRPVIIIAESLSSLPVSPISSVIWQIEQKNGGKYFLASAAGPTMPHTPKGTPPPAWTSSSGM